MLYVSVRDVMVFSVRIVTRGAVCARVCMSVVMQMLYVCVLCVSCGSSQCCILQGLQFAGRGCKRRPYGRCILQRCSHDCLIGSHECLLLFIPSCSFEYFYHL